MPLPVSLNTVTVSFTFLKHNGDAEVGSVSFTRAVYLRSTSDDTIVTPGGTVVNLDSSGQGSAILPVTDDAQWTPVGWTYTVQETMTGGSREYTISLPQAEGNKNLADIAPVNDPDGGVQYVLLTSVGQIGGPAGPLDGTGKVPAAQIPATGGGIPASDFAAKGDILVGTGSGTYDNLPVGTNGQVLVAASGETTGVDWADAPVTGISPTIVDAKGDLIAATGADAVARLPVGSNGQVLKANSGTSTGLEWAAEAGGGSGIPASTVDAKGDLIVGTAADTVARKAVGSNGQFLKADSAQGDGLAWAAPAISEVTGLQTALDGKQPIDADLTTIAGLTATTDNVIQSVGSAWASRTPTQLKSTLALAKGDVGLGNVDNTQQQPIDADLTAIAALTPTNDDVIQRKSGAWTNRTMAQVKTDLALTKGDVGLGNVDNLQQQPIDADLTAIAALTPTNDDVIQRKSGAWTNRTMAQIKTDLALVKGDVGLGNVDNTSDANKPVSTATQTALDLKVDKSLVDAKGDIVTATADNTPARLAVGSNGQFLRADSAQATGLLWDTLDSSDLPAHNHSAADVASGTLGVARGGTGLSTVTTDSYVKGAGTGALVPRTPSQVLSDIGAAAAAHTHTIRKTIPFDFAGNLATGAGAARWYNREGVTLTLVGTWLYVVTAPATTSIIVDVNKNGTTIYTTQANRPTIAAAANTASNAMTAPDVTTLADGDYITIDIDQVGTGTVGADLNGGIVVTYAG